MAKTEFTAGMDEIMKPVSALLKDRGFRKSARNFNRLVGDGMIQVVTVQMGRYEFDAQEIPGLRYNVHGKFTVNLGVLLPCVYLADGFRPLDREKVVNEGLCSIRSRLGPLTPMGQDAWWSIQEPFAPIASEVRKLTAEFGLPFLEQYLRYQDVTGYYETHKQLPGVPEARSAMIAALIYHEHGNPSAAAEAFRRARELAVRNQGYVQHLVSLESRLLGRL